MTTKIERGIRYVATTIDIDLAETIFQIDGVDAERIVGKPRLTLLQTAEPASAPQD